MTCQTISAGYPRALLDFAVSKGADRGALLTASCLNDADLNEQDDRVDIDRYVALFAAAADLTGEPAIALQFGEAVRMQDISIVGLICEACETTIEVGHQLNRYGALVLDDARGEPATLMRGQWEGDALWIEMPHSLFAAHPAIVEAEFARVFQAPVVFNSRWNAMRIDPAFLTLKQPPVNRYVFGVLSARADALLKSLQESRTMRGRVEALLVPILHTGDLSMDLVAQKLGLSRQTLYRNLKAEGVTYETVLDELRHKMAVNFLAGKKVSVNETAYLVGFSEPAAFSRAFKRWTGASPRSARKA